MIVLESNLEKEKYRSIQSKLFDITAEETDLALGKKFKNSKKYIWSFLEFDDLYEEIKSKFYNIHSEFCIATALEFEPIFLFDLKKDDYSIYNGIIYSPHSIDLDFPDPDNNVGIAITNEKIFFYSTDENWCLYSDRYNDEIILAWD